MSLSSESVHAVVLAGGTNSIPLFDGYVPGYKALLPVRGKTLIEHTLHSLIQSPQVKRICIVGPAEEIRERIPRSDRYDFVAGGPTLIESIRQGLSWFRESESILMIPSDLPLTTPGAIAHFLAAATRMKALTDAAVFWSMVPEQYLSGRFAPVRKKGLNRFRDVSVCHGNLFLVTPGVLSHRTFLPRLDAIYHARKSSIRAALAIGPLTGLGYLIGVHLFRILTLSEFARLASAGFDIELIPVISPYAEIAADIDEARDYVFIQNELDRRERDRESIPGTGRITESVRGEPEKNIR